MILGDLKDAVCRIPKIKVINWDCLSLVPIQSGDLEGSKSSTNLSLDDLGQLQLSHYW